MMTDPKDPRDESELTAALDGGSGFEPADLTDAPDGDDEQE